MEATAWTVVGAAIAILVAIGTSFRSLRDEMRTQIKDLRQRVDAQGDDLRQRVDAQGDDLRQRIDAQSEQMGQLRERMAHLEGLLEGLREAITRRVA